MIDQGNVSIGYATLAGVGTIMSSTGHMNENLEYDRISLERENILEYLSSLTFRDKQRDVFAKREKGTAQWLLETEKFQEWFSGPQNSTLWCSGIPGAGKTVMTSVAIDYVSEINFGRKYAVAYAYCDYKNSKTHLALELVSSLVKQLAEQSDTVSLEVKKFYYENAKKNRNPSDDERLELFRALSRLFQKTYIFIDALDECPELEKDKFLRFLQKMEPFTRIFVTSRPNVNLEPEFSNLSRVNISASESDIKAYCESEICKNRTLFTFITKEPQLKDDILNKINEKACGMFLLARMQIGALCEQTNRRMVRRTMDTLPTGVYATYEETIRRIKDQPKASAALAMKTLSYIFSAKRLLKLEELRHALAVEAEDIILDETSFSETETILHVSAGLITIDEQSSTIRLVHYTLQEYLKDICGELFPDAELQISKACLTYLSFDDFKSGPCSENVLLQRRLQKYPFLDYASHNWGHHVREAQQQELMVLILGYLRDEPKMSCSVQILYASSTYWHNGWHNFPKQYTPLHAVAYWGLNMILVVLLREAVDINIRNSYGRTALHLAASRGHEVAVQLLVEKGAHVEAQDANRWTPLHLAALNGQEAALELLLESGANVENKDSYGSTALHQAVLNGREVAVQLLLGKGANVEAQDSYGSTALHSAASDGYKAAVQLLLERGVNVEARDSYGSTALQLAASHGYKAVVQLLLENGANIKTQDSSKWTALQSAASNGHEAAVHLLLEKGADIESRNMNGMTALHLAVAGKHERVVQLLLKKGADVEAQNSEGRTVLRWAAMHGHKAMVLLLLEKGADIEAQHSNGRTALHLATSNGHIAVVQLLLEEGADIEVQDSDGKTALQQSVSKGHGVMVQLLLKNGASSK